MHGLKESLEGRKLKMKFMSNLSCEFTDIIIIVIVVNVILQRKKFLIKFDQRFFSHHVDVYGKV